MFFKIPKAQEEELNLWELTVFKFAGEYLESVAGVLQTRRSRQASDIVPVDQGPEPRLYRNAHQ